MTNTPTTYRFRLYTADSVGAYTCVHATCQAVAFEVVKAQLAPWEKTAPLYGPSQTPQWFTA
jgi:hypothetical protein